jgi:hypothetical protein
MAAKGYTTEADIENYMLKDIDPSFSSVIDEWIEGAEETVDLITGRNFIADAAATVRYFDGDNEKSLLIDDCVEITKVELGQDDYGGTFQEIAATGPSRYFADPVNAIALGQPFTKLTLRATRWTAGKQNHKITAKWGYSVEVPKAIKRATTIIVAGIINQNTPGGEEIKSERIGNYQVTYNSEKGNNSVADYEEMLRILDQYKKYYL